MRYAAVAVLVGWAACRNADERSVTSTVEASSAVRKERAAELPDHIVDFHAGNPEIGQDFTRRAYSRNASVVVVTLGHVDLGPGGYEGWVRQSVAGYPQATLQLAPEMGNGFYECSDATSGPCSLLIQLAGGAHLEIRGERGATRADVDDIAAGLPLAALAR